MPSIPAWSSGTGGGSPSLNGIGLGPTTVQPPSSGVFRRAPPFHGRSQLALRPAWASWIPATAPCLCTNRAIRASGSTCASLQIPMSPGVIRPSGVTARRLDHHQRHAADRPAPEVDQVPVVGHPLGRAVLAHRRHHDPVPQLDPPDLQRTEEVDLRHLAVVIGARRDNRGPRPTLVGRPSAGCSLMTTSSRCQGELSRPNPRGHIMDHAGTKGTRGAGRAPRPPSARARPDRRPGFISRSGFDLPTIGASSYAERVRQPIMRRWGRRRQPGARRQESPPGPARSPNRECDRMSETQEPRPPQKDKIPFVPGQPLPRLWKTEPDPEEDPDESQETPDEEERLQEQGRRRIRIQVVEQVQGDDRQAGQAEAGQAEAGEEEAERRRERRETRPAGGDPHVRHDRVAAAGPPDHGRPHGLLRLHRGLERLAHALRRLQRHAGSPSEADYAAGGVGHVCPGRRGLARARGALHARPRPGLRQAGTSQGRDRHAQAASCRSTRAPGRPARPQAALDRPKHNLPLFPDGPFVLAELMPADAKPSRLPEPAAFVDAGPRIAGRRASPRTRDRPLGTAAGRPGGAATRQSHRRPRDRPRPVPSLNPGTVGPRPRRHRRLP